MRLRAYLAIAVIAFLLATTGSDLVVRTSIGNETFTYALRDHAYWAGVQFIGTLLLLAPFVAVALICAHAEKQARTRSVALIFAVAMLTLLYFYYQGYWGAESATLEKKWTAAALSIGLLPFFIGIPVTLVVLGLGTLAATFDRRTVDQSNSS